MTTNILKERLDKGPVICAEGFLFEIERRGYMASGEFVPMVSLSIFFVIFYLQVNGEKKLI